MAGRPLEQMRARVVLDLVETVPGLEAEDAVRLLAEAKVLEVRPVRELEAFLHHCPDATTRPVGDFPLSWVRLAHRLHAAGYRVVLPTCAGCGATVAALLRSPKGRVCSRCAPKREPKLCARCGRTALITARRAEGGICNRCYLNDPAVQVPCARCSRPRPPAGRAAQSRPVCQLCWGRPVRTCSACGTLAPTKTNGPDGPLCQPCYQRTRQPRHLCTSCGDLARISRRTDRSAEGEGGICYSCYRRPTVEAPCAVCGRQRPCYRERGGSMTCWACRPLPERTCTRCRRARPVAANWPMGPVCSPCYQRIRTRPEPCPECGTCRPLVGTAHLPGTGETAICGPCAGADTSYRCTNCGSEEGAYAGGQCLRCVLDHRLRDRLARPRGPTPCAGSPRAPPPGSWPASPPPTGRSATTCWTNFLPDTPSATFATH